MTPEWNAVAKAATLGLGLSALGMPAYLAGMRRLGWGQKIREEGPKDHASKSGTPTMGGGLFVPAGLLASFWAGHWSAHLFALWVLTLGCWLLGMTDDLTKVMRNHNLGLKARHKLLIQTGLSLAMGIYLACHMTTPGVEIPLYGFVAGIWAVLALTWLVVSGTTNAVNLTDGLDGLAAGTVLSSLAAYVVIGMASGHPDLAVAAAGMGGATLAFLWFNSFPARIFMGDTGSMGLGGMLAGLALLTDTSFLLVWIGGVYVMEAVSVMMQVSFFKLTRGKRIFRMSPIHHHFCLGGMHEVQVTQRMWIASLLLACSGLYAYLGGLL
jgi:phospho-N-acetylmuramoyl-pentapeptide-transferase